MREKPCRVYRPSSRETATVEDLRLFRLHLGQGPLGAASVNTAMTALRFFSATTLDRSRSLFHVYEPQKLPTVLTQDEVARLLDAAPGAKYKAALSVERDGDWNQSSKHG